MPEITEEQLKGILTELDNGSIMIVKQEDLEFIQGAKMTVDMEFPLAPGDVQRVLQIYEDFKKTQHNTMKIE